jgi:hypothetical protein
MPPKPKGRPNYPSEDAVAARGVGIEVLEVALAYLNEPDGLNSAKDLEYLIEPVEASLAELEALTISLKWNDAAPPAILEAFGRADKAAEDVMTMTRVDDESSDIHGPLGEFRDYYRGAAKAAPVAP